MWGLFWGQTVLNSVYRKYIVENYRMTDTTVMKQYNEK